MTTMRADDVDRDHAEPEPQRCGVPVDPSPDDQTTNENHLTPVVGSPSPVEAIHGSVSKDTAPRPDYSMLALVADSLDDFEGARIAMRNRVDALIRLGGGGSPEVARLQGTADGLRALEHSLELELKRTLRKLPLGAWVKRTVGVGEKQGARLLAAIGDPGKRDTVSQLWAYCGYHVVAGVAPSRTRGQRANWNATAKIRAYLVAESCMKHRGSPYRAVYDDGKAKYAEAVHVHPCRRCGPAGRPAVVGSPLSDGHKHARALRLVAKSILRDLWIEARA